MHDASRAAPSRRSRDAARPDTPTRKVTTCTPTSPSMSATA